MWHFILDEKLEQLLFIILLLAITWQHLNQRADYLPVIQHRFSVITTGS